jgi:hypothetical protein
MPVNSYNAPVFTHLKVIHDWIKNPAIQGGGRAQDEPERAIKIKRLSWVYQHEFWTCSSKSFTARPVARRLVSSCRFGRSAILADGGEILNIVLEKVFKPPVSLQFSNLTGIFLVARAS